MHKRGRRGTTIHHPAGGGPTQQGTTRLTCRCRRGGLGGRPAHSLAARRPPPGTPPNESRRGGASSEREVVVVRKRTRGDGKNQTKARSHLLQQRGQSLNPPCRRFACVASRRARALAASHVTARAPGGGRQVTVRVTGRVGPLRRRATREAHAQITLGARAPRAGRDREQPDASVLSAHSIRPASVTEHVGPS